MAQIIDPEILQPTIIMSDFELLKKSLLFDDEEIRKIMNDRKEWDYRIEKQLKSLRDFIEYIKFERELFGKISERYKAKEVGRPKQLEASVITRMIKLYKNALFHYPQEAKLWDNFLIFCTRSKRMIEIKPHLQKWLQFHGDKQQVWVKVVQLEYEEFHNLIRSRTTLSQGLLRHPQSSELYIMAFKIDLQEAAKQYNNTQLHSEKCLANLKKYTASAETTYVNSKNNIHNIEFMIKLLDLCEPYEFTKLLQNHIIRDMTEIFPSYELTWNKLARRELDGFHLVKIFPKDFIPDSDPNSDKLTPRKRIQFCIKIFERAVSLMKTESMWTLYIETMIHINRDLTTLQMFKRECLLLAYKNGHDQRCLTEYHYIQYVNLLLDTNHENEMIHQICNHAVGVYFESVDLWALFMRYYIMQDLKQKAQEVFTRALRKIALADSLELWQMYYEYLLAGLDHRTIDEFFQHACSKAEPVSKCFKPKYIEWKTLTKNIETARETFNVISKHKPYCYEMNKKMLSLYLLLLKTRQEHTLPYNVYAARYVDLTRSLLESTKEQFGKFEPRVWIDCIIFERDYGEIKDMNTLYEQAKDTLDECHIESFLTQYDLMKNGYM